MKNDTMNQPHQTKDVICEGCGVKYCLTCQPMGCKCGEIHYKPLSFRLPTHETIKKLLENEK